MLLCTLQSTLFELCVRVREFNQYYMRPSLSRRVALFRPQSRHHDWTGPLQLPL
jgi:hypothetical protein